MTLERFLHHENIGCRFAKYLATNKRVYHSVIHSPAGVASINDLFLGARKERMCVVLTFPFVRNISGLCILLNSLSRLDKWSLSVSEGVREDTVDIACVWRTPTGFKSRLMGFAPLLSMPVTRRADTVAIAAWPGDSENRFRPHKSQKRKQFVSFADSAIPQHLTLPQYDRMWEQSTTDVKELMKPEKPRKYLSVAFSLAHEYSQLLQFAPNGQTVLALE